MTKKNSTKKALITSALCLLLCVSMLVGATFAWFTDSVTSTNNVITAGNLDVNMYWSTDASNWTPVEADTNVFTKDLWEPGHTEVVYLKVVNEGTLALKYNVNINIASEKGSVNVLGEEFELSDYIMYGVKPVTAAYANRTAAKNDVSSIAVGLKTAFAPEVQALYPADNTPDGCVSEVTLAVVVYMPTDVGNEANYKTGEEAPEINLGINLMATQLDYEQDSFGPDYDINAKYFVDAGETATYVNPTIDEGVINNGELTIVGGTITNDGYGVQTHGNTTLTDVTVNAGNAGNYGLIAQGADAVLTLNNVNLPSAGGGVGANGGAQVTVNDSTISVNSSSTSGRYVFYAAGEGTVITINGGNYSFSNNLSMKRAYVYADNGTTVYINGGTFGKPSTRSDYKAGIMGNGTVIITGGTFGFNPTTWVADGYKAIKNGSTWTVVPENVNEVVSNATQLQAALDAATGDYIIYINADIEGDVTATQKAGVNVTINGNGNTFAGVIVVDGKSATYMTAGLTIKNVVFKADSISADAIVRLGNGTNATRYTCNVTVENCTFDVPGAVGVKSYTGGDKNLTITGCTATANAHSLVQAKGIDVVLVENCNVYSKNGLNFNNSDNVTVRGCDVDVKGYAVRFGEGSAADTTAETYTIENCTLKSANDDGDATIVLRGTAACATLTIVNTTIEGTPDITNTVGATVVK